MPLDLILKLPKSDLTKTQILRRQRYKKWLQSPNCHWCSVETVFVEDVNSIKGKQKEICATIDHVYSRLQPELRRNGNNKHVLACWKCNNNRSKIENNQLPIEELRARSGRYPRNNIVIPDLTFN